VSDNYDRRVLQTYMHEFYGDFLFDTFQPFFFSRIGHDYTLPDDKDGSIKQYNKMIEGLPLVNSPAVFGLHPNAEIAFFISAIKGMWKDLICMQPRTAGEGGGNSFGDFVSKAAKEVAGSLPKVFDLNAIKKQATKPTPTRVVLLQEIERWNLLVVRMTVSLEDLQRALKGEIGMSEALDGLGDSIFNGFMPAMWRILAPKTEKPLSAWMTHFHRRFKQYDGWINDCAPIVMWLSGLHIPESFLSALVQMTCRAKNWPLDKSTLYTSVSIFKDASDVETPMEYGTYVCGLFLEGAAWDLEKRLITEQPPKVLVQELPLLQVIPIEARKLKLKNTFKVPVYVTQARRNAMGVGLVFSADLASREHGSHWVLQGCALCLSVDC